MIYHTLQNPASDWGAQCVGIYFIIKTQKDNSAHKNTWWADFLLWWHWQHDTNSSLASIMKQQLSHCSLASVSTTHNNSSAFISLASTWLQHRLMCVDQWEGSVQRPCQNNRNHLAYIQQDTAYIVHTVAGHNLVYLTDHHDVMTLIITADHKGWPPFCSVTWITWST